VVTLPDNATARVPGLVLAKEVCTGGDATDCGTAAGPWGEIATARADGVVQWRITVTNTGGVDLTALTVQDSVEPTCVTAAGAFDLAVGAVKRVYCLSAAVATALVNTATVSYPLPNAPVGTPLVVSPPDSARVEAPPASPVPSAAPPLAWTGVDIGELVPLGFLLLVVGMTLCLRRNRRVA
jgi:hypothetical protein